MKKTFALFILLIFSLNIIGMYIPFYLMRSLIRNEMNEKANVEISSKSLVQFTFFAKNIQRGFNWTIKGHEFKFDNEMYDIVKAEKSGDKVIYYCLHDKDETNLNKIFNVLVKKDSAKDKKENASLTKVLSKFKLSINSQLLFSPHSAFQDAAIMYFYQSLRKKVYPPPPKHTLTT